MIARSVVAPLLCWLAELRLVRRRKRFHSREDLKDHQRVRPQILCRFPGW